VEVVGSNPTAPTIVSKLWLSSEGVTIPMQKITPHLWFDTEAKEAAEFYTSIFKNSAIKNTATLYNTPSGTVDLLSIELLGQEFRFLNAGPLFKFTPAVSFLVACDTKDEVDALWKELSKGGSALMELGEYPFSERYGWTKDRYGLSWQVMFMGDRKIEQKITPTLMFAGEQCGRAEEAINFYSSVFHEAKVGHILRYGENEEPDQAGTIKHAGIALDGETFAVMDSARVHNFTFNEAISFIVHCHDQEEIDYFWSKLSEDGKAGQCGWLKDKFGLSWQIVPTIMDEMLTDKNEPQLARVTEAFLKMKKFDIAKLKEAHGQGKSAA
jgi:predicted 3-demethylubiquinone-9 3-methyltransferase (glyoxalase superfamily)